MARKPKAGADAAETRPEADDIDRDLMAVVEATDPHAAPDPAPDTARVEPAAPAPAPAPADAPLADRSRRGSGLGAFAGMMLGGAIVFAGGFGVARYMPDLLPALGAGAAADARLAALEERLAALPAPDTALADRVAALESAVPSDPAPPDLSQIEARLADLDARLAALAAAPAAAPSADGGADLADLRQQIAALQAGGPAAAKAGTLAAEAEQRLAQVQAAADALRSETEAAVAATRRSAALTRLSAALDSGIPYAAALEDLGADVPPVLSDAAQTGLPTLAALQASFPQAARAALDAAVQDDMGASWADRVGNFLKLQTGARSLHPRDGTDPDAVLSRAEAALGAGDVAAALAEIATLPAPAQQAMSDWTAAATQRVQAAEAVAALAAQG